MASRFRADKALEFLENVSEDEIQDESDLEDEMSDENDDMLRDVYDTYVHGNGGIRVRREPDTMDSVLHTADDLQAAHKVCLPFVFRGFGFFSTSYRPKIQKAYMPVCGEKCKIFLKMASTGSGKMPMYKTNLDIFLLIVN